MTHPSSWGVNTSYKEIIGACYNSLQTTGDGVFSGRHKVGHYNASDDTIRLYAASENRRHIFVK